MSETLRHAGGLAAAIAVTVPEACALLVDPGDRLAYVGYFNRARPHQGIGQRTPLPPAAVRASRPYVNEGVIAVPVLGGLHHEYRLVA